MKKKQLQEQCSDCSNASVPDATGAPDLTGWLQHEFGYQCPECQVKNENIGETFGIEVIAELTGAIKENDDV